MSERTYHVTVDGAEYKLKDGCLPAMGVDGIYRITVIRASGDESTAYCRLRNGPYSFKQR